MGIPHPPGYPLYVLLGRAATAVPIGDLPFRLNVTSAVFGALAAVAIYAIAFELTRQRAAAFAASLSLAFSYHFWGQSLVAEVYTLDAALLAGLLYATCLYQRTQRPAALYAAFFLLGLALAHRTTSLFLVPPLLAWGVANGSRRNVDLWLRAFCFLIPGLSLYLLLPVLYAAQPDYLWNAGYTLSGEPAYVDLTTREGLTWYATAQVFRPLAFAFGPAGVLRETARYASWLWSEFAGVGAILGAAGFTRAWRQHRPFLYLTAGAFALQAWFYINYGALDKDQMFLATYVIWSLWIGLGVKELLDLAGSGYLRAFAVPAVRALALALPVALLFTNFAALDFSGDSPVRDGTQRLFAAAPEGTLVIGEWGDIASVQYEQTVEHERPDLTLVGRWALTRDDLRQLVAANIGRRPVYVLEDVPALRKDFRFVKIGDWYRLEPLTGKGGS